LNFYGSSGIRISLWASRFDLPIILRGKEENEREKKRKQLIN